ncbi:MAG: hypothetical protein CBC22_03055 [Alphaproteobacteria bacterium TMED62]|nr:MAG: hypothetical protein CBC22_03055 [Alphaproteobacteria bacterium TMED62]|tara:strand:+ start:422 stop:880 length:459 start_codon:yes stop_codon:yes gene_type:complete
MFNSFFKKKIKNREKNISTLDENVFTIACILVEAALIDENFGSEEKKIITKIIKNNFKLNNIKEIQEVIERAVKSCKESSDLITFTRKIKQNWSIDKRIEVIEMLWKVCLVDGVLEPYEDMLIRRVSGLIYVDDKNRNIAKINALKKLDTYK